MTRHRPQTVFGISSIYLVAGSPSIPDKTGTPIHEMVYPELSHSSRHHAKGNEATGPSPQVPGSHHLNLALNFRPPHANVQHPRRGAEDLFRIHRWCDSLTASSALIFSAEIFSIPSTLWSAGRQGMIIPLFSFHTSTTNVDAPRHLRDCCGARNAERERAENSSSS